MKTYVYVVHDKTDQNIRKPFMSIHLDEEEAKAQVVTLSKNLPDHAKGLVYYDTVEAGKIYGT